MANVFERLLGAAEHFFRLSSQALTGRNFLKASELSASTMGILRFLAHDPETPAEILQRVDRIFATVERRMFDANIRLIRSKMEPGLSGKKDPEAAAMAHVEDLIQDLDKAAREAIREVGS